MKTNSHTRKEVRQNWKHYSLEADGIDHLEDQWTDENGYASFPERTIRASILRRIVLTAFTGAMTLAHGSVGISAGVAATGPQGYQRLEYDPGQPLPRRLVLPSQPTERSKN